MSTEMSSHFVHLLQVLKNISEVWFYTFFSWFITCIYPPGQMQTVPMGQHLDVNKKALSLYPFVTVKKIPLKSDLIQFFHVLIHGYSPKAGGRQPPGDTVFQIIDDNSFWKIYCFTFFPYKSIRDQIWPCHKICQGQPMVIIWTNMVVLEHPILHTKFPGHRPYGSGEEDFLRFLPYMGIMGMDYRVHHWEILVPSLNINSFLWKKFLFSSPEPLGS